MRRRAISILLATGGALIISSGASANYTGLSVSLFTSVIISGQARSVWRLYADFSNPGDYMYAVAGSPLSGNMVIRQTTSNGAFGSGFYNHPFGQTVAPLPALIAMFPDVQWDTFVTIGLAMGPQPDPDQTTLSPGFPSQLLSGTGGESDNAAWFVPGFTPQGYAGNFPGLRVMLAQFTVNAGEHVSGTATISGFNAGDLAATFQSNGQTFSSLPAPGATVVWGIAVLYAGRRARG